MQIDLTPAEAWLLREAIAGRQALEVWTGDGALADLDAVTSYQDLYCRLGGTFTEHVDRIVQLAKTADGGR